MKAACIKIVAPYKVVLDEICLDAASLGDSEVLIRSRYSLTNPGTELAAFTGLEAEFSADFRYGSVLGRANVGTIERLGSAVCDLSEGDIVLSFGPHASTFKIDRAHIMAIVPEDIDPGVACLARMAAVSLTAVRKADLTAGDPVLVIGQGLVGNFAAQLFRLVGADVMAADVVPSRLEVARQCGIDRTVNPATSDFKEALSVWTEGRGPRIVVEAVGKADLICEAVDLVAPRGEVILLGTPRRKMTLDVSHMLLRIHAEGITMKGAYLWDFPAAETPFARHSVFGNVEQILGWMRDGRLKTAPLLTRVLPPRQCQRAYDALDQDKAGCQSVLFDWAVVA
ncbi:MAG: hypothetical protein CMJ18_10235 [Phycisphaeraceae bacterium]|nr:hypothetical protein [Phycisphaeraceae bacterium]